jgi:hypothetical protein
MRTNIFAEGEEFLNTIGILEEKGFVCKENTSKTSAICIDYNDHMIFRVNQLYDSDMDGIPDGVDCDPHNPMFQDYGSPIMNPNVGDTERTLNGYKLDDYYFSNGRWHVIPNAKPVFKRQLFKRKKR